MPSAARELREPAMDMLSAHILTEEPQPEAACAELCPECQVGECEEMLRRTGLRPTRQRVMLARLLFAEGNRHVTADTLYTEAAVAGMQLSPATVYNTLNQFTQAGLLRRIGPDGSRSFFDTNTSVHPHFYLEDEGMLMDVPGEIILDQMPEALPGHEVSRLDIIIHIRRTGDRRL